MPDCLEPPGLAYGEDQSFYHYQSVRSVIVDGMEWRPGCAVGSGACPDCANERTGSASREDQRRFCAAGSGTTFCCERRRNECFNGSRPGRRNEGARGGGSGN